MKCMLSNCAVRPFKKLTVSCCMFTETTLPLTRCAFKFLINMTGRPVFKCKNLTSCVFEVFGRSFVYGLEMDSSHASSFCIF